MLLLVSWGLNTLLHKKIISIEGSYKSLYNFHVEVCFTTKNCKGNKPKCQFCVKPTVDIFSIFGYKITGVPKYNIINTLPEINISRLHDYLGKVSYRIVTKLIDSRGRSFAKNGIIYDIPSDYRYAIVIVYFDSYGVNCTIDEINNAYKDGLSIYMLLSRTIANKPLK